METGFWLCRFNDRAGNHFAGVAGAGDDLRAAAVAHAILALAHAKTASPVARNGRERNFSYTQTIWRRAALDVPLG